MTVTEKPCIALPVWENKQRWYCISISAEAYSSLSSLNGSARKFWQTFLTARQINHCSDFLVLISKNVTSGTQGSVYNKTGTHNKRTAAGHKHTQRGYTFRYFSEKRARLKDWMLLTVMRPRSEGLIKSIPWAIKRARAQVHSINIFMTILRSIFQFFRPLSCFELKHDSHQSWSRKKPRNPVLGRVPITATSCMFL